MIKEDKQGIAIISTLLLIGAVTFYATYQLKPKKYHIDVQSLCSKDEVVQLKKIVLIDKSDRWSEHNIEKIDSWLSSIHEDLSMNNRLNILSIFSDEQNNTMVKTLFDKCSPGSELECNALYENCREIKENYNDAFQRPLLEITDMLERPGEAKSSPLIETMTEVVDGIESQEAEVHLVSDLMENGHKFNFYKEIPAVEELIREYPLQTQATVRIHIHMIERRKHERELIDKVRALWQEYFEKQGITVVSAKRFFITN